MRLRAFRGRLLHSDRIVFFSLFSISKRTWKIRGNVYDDGPEKEKSFFLTKRIFDSKIKEKKKKVNRLISLLSGVIS